MSAEGRERHPGPRRAVLAVVLVVLLGACSGGKPGAAPATTEPSTVAPSTSAPTSTSSTTSTTVRSSTTSTTRTTVGTATLGPGDAFISGTVQGPAGPVDGATVHIERLVASGMASADVTTAGGGAWRMDNVLGGAYRIKAFKAPDLGQSNVEVFFLAAADRKTVDLRLAGAGAGGQQVLAVVNPNPPRANQPAILTIQIGSPRVDDQGRPTILPQVGTVLQLSVGAGVVLESPPQVATDATGAASWRIRCLIEGPVSVSVAIGNGVSPVNVPPCAAVGSPAATTTTRAR